LHFFCRFQKLLKEEYALSNELKSLKITCDDWNRAVSPSVLKPPVRRVSKFYISNTDSNKEVSEEIFASKCYDYSIILQLQLILPLSFPLPSFSWAFQCWNGWPVVIILTKGHSVVV